MSFETIHFAVIMMPFIFNKETLINILNQNNAQSTCLEAIQQSGFKQWLAPQSKEVKNLVKLFSFGKK